MKGSGLKARALKRNEWGWLEGQHQRVIGTFYDPLDFRTICRDKYSDWAFYAIEPPGGFKIGFYTLTLPPQDPQLLVDSDRLYMWLYHFVMDYRWAERSILREYISYITYVLFEDEYRKATLEKLGFQTIRLSDTMDGKVWVLYRE